MKTRTSHSLRYGIIGVLLGAATVGVAASTARITNAKVAGSKLVATVQSGASKKQVAIPNYIGRNSSFVIGENGAALVYEAVPGQGVKGGYENEKAAVGRYLAEGEFYVLMEAPLGLDRIRQYRSRRGRTAYVISMSDGGAGIPYVYVCSTSGEVWNKRAVRVNGVRNGKLILNRYVDSEEAGIEGAKPIGTLYLDLDTLLALDS